MSVLIKKYKKLVKQLLFTYSELEFVDEVLRDAHVEFEKYLQEYCKENDVPIQELNESNKEIVDKACHRTLRKLGAVKPASQEVPVIFSSEMAQSFFGKIRFWDFWICGK